MEGTTKTPVHATVTSQRIPVGGTREVKESVSDVGGLSGGEAMSQLKHGAEQVYDKACDMCHNWRHYPKLLTTVVLLSTFLLGSLTAGGVQRMGFFGGSRNYVSSHWDRETSDAHHALDVVLDHLKYPQMYQSEKGTSYVNRARHGLMSIFEGILPGRRSSSSYGRDAYDEATGRSLYDKITGRGITDKASDMMQDVAHGARRGMEQVRDSGYGIGHKLSGVADSVKHTLIGDRGRDSYTPSSEGGSSWFGGSKDSHQQPSRGSSWFGGSDDKYIPQGRDEYDDFGLAADKIKKVVRSAEREM